MEPVSEHEKTPESRIGLSSVTNAMRLIKAFSEDDGEIGISDLGKRLQLPKSTVHRLAAALIEGGFLAQDGETGKYRLGLTVFELGALVYRTRAVRSGRKSAMTGTADDF